MPIPRNKTGVYCWLNAANGKRYIGSGAKCLQGRKEHHLNDLASNRHWNRHLQAAWNKYGADRFQFCVLEYCESDLCLVREQYWIDHYQAADQRFGYNLSPTAGSPLGVRRSEKTKKLISKVKKKQGLSPELRQKIVAANRRRRGTKRGPNKVQSSHKGRKLSALHKAALAAAWVRRRRKFGNSGCENREAVTRKAIQTRLANPAARGESHWNNRLSNEQVLEIHRRATSGEPNKNLAEEFGIDPSAVSRIKSGRRRSWLTETKVEAPIRE